MYAPCVQTPLRSAPLGEINSSSRQSLRLASVAILQGTGKITGDGVTIKGAGTSFKRSMTTEHQLAVGGKVRAGRALAVLVSAWT